MKRLAAIVVGLGLLTCLLPAAADEHTPARSETAPAATDAWQAAGLDRSITVNGEAIGFAARIEAVPLFDEQGKPQAHMHAFTYTRTDGNTQTPRPITFLFNGGPGSSSVWLHLGAFGPYRIGLDEQGVAIGPPYALNENPNTLLPHTDLVFIDPITTGHSRAAAGVDANRTFRSVSGDLHSVAQFIYRYLTKHQRWDSPIYLGGESYGTTRAAGLTKLLQDRHGIYPSGVILISSILDFATIQYGPLDDRAFAGILPTYAALARYHGKSGPPSDNRQGRPAISASALVHGYWGALIQPPHAEGHDRPAQTPAAARLGALIGVDPTLLEQTSLRLHPSRFRSELLKDENLVIGRFDGRYTLPDTEPANPWPSIDPSYSLVHGAFTAGIHQLMADLGYETNEPYVILKGGSWDFESKGRPLETASRLVAAMNANPSLRVYVASGIYDLATPYHAARMTIDRYFTEPSARSRFTFVDYEAGHMMFTHRPSHEKLVQSIAAWMRE